MDYCTAVKKNELELGVLELRDMQEVKRSHCKTPTYSVMPFLERNTGKYSTLVLVTCVCASLKTDGREHSGLTAMVVSGVEPREGPRTWGRLQSESLALFLKRTNKQINADHKYIRLLTTVQLVQSKSVTSVFVLRLFARLFI